MKVSGRGSVCWMCGWVGGSAQGSMDRRCSICTDEGIMRRGECLSRLLVGVVFSLRHIGTHEGVGEVERVLDVRLGGWFSPRERGRVQAPQKVGSAVAIAVAIALRVVEVIELQGRSIGTHEGVGEVERLLDVRLGGWFSPREYVCWGG
ncbi:uncharacterized protein EMH_0096380 [Eimeria mitis]|uniref:Uncharacterized protein n=1 Tax=Eimeria mitis TaxID=44415 RepID=U6KEQ5_9EIME|nr:uncharacterized protein EMH_0096380 [Eimeria mitis]CDJ35281.1 hypothetical protein EMH_0096380 [Eimeria mitis]